MYGTNLILLLLLLMFCDTLLSYYLALIRTITVAGIPARRNNWPRNMLVKAFLIIKATP